MDWNKIDVPANNAAGYQTIFKTAFKSALSTHCALKQELAEFWRFFCTEVIPLNFYAWQIIRVDLWPETGRLAFYPLNTATKEHPAAVAVMTNNEVEKYYDDRVFAAEDAKARAYQELDEFQEWLIRLIGEAANIADICAILQKDHVRIVFMVPHADEVLAEVAVSGK